MNVFIPYPSPIDVAKCLDSKRLRSQINECTIILETIRGYSNSWWKHPIMKMYEDDVMWLANYQFCLSAYFNKSSRAEYYSKLADTFRPEWMTEEICDQHKRRLYTKAPHLYPQFAKYGTSEDNWYVADGEIIKFRNGKRI